MIALHKIIIFLIQIQLFMISVNCLKKLESNLVVEENNNDKNNNKELMEKLLGPNYKSAIQYDIKNNNPQVQIFNDDEKTSDTNNNNQQNISKYQEYLRQINNAHHNYAAMQNYQHQLENNNYYPNKLAHNNMEQKDIMDILNIRNNQKRDNNNQIKKPCNGKKHKDDDQPTPTYFYPKHTKGELVVHNPAPIIVKRPPTKVVVNHPAIIVRPQPVLINRTPQAINPVMVYKPPPPPPAEPLKIRPVFVKFESAIPDQHQHHHHHQHPHPHQHYPHNGGYPHRRTDDDEEEDGLYSEGTNLNFNGSPYYNNDGYQANNNQPRYNGYNNFNI